MPGNSQRRTLVKSTSRVRSKTKVMKCFPSPRSKPVRDGLLAPIRVLIGGVCLGKAYDAQSNTDTVSERLAICIPHQYQSLA